MLRISNSIAQKCGANLGFKANSIKQLPQGNMLGILQERRKRLFDIVVSASLLIFLFPALLIIAFAIYITSSGPVLFKQERYGRFKRPFMILKFRSMTVMEAGNNFTQATRNDPRITRLGSFLRRTSLDELPQLWNVFRGDMSLVGPRPHCISMDDDYAKRIADYDQRFLMRPGITGLAQATGFRGNTNDMSKMVGRLCRDLHYVRNRTMMMDMKILLQTVKSLLSHDAY